MIYLKKAILKNLLELWKCYKYTNLKCKEKFLINVTKIINLVLISHLYELIGLDEIMYVLKGTGIVKNQDGEYPYNVGDVFMYPMNVFREIYNNGDIESEYIFIRIHKKTRFI